MSEFFSQVINANTYLGIGGIGGIEGTEGGVLGRSVEIRKSGVYEYVISEPEPCVISRAYVPPLGTPFGVQS